jgi:hypothetical protein
MPAMPGCGLFAGRLQHPTADRDDQPGRFRERYERVRRDHATDRVAPADQRLDAGDRLALQVERRLVEQEELAGVERVLEVDLEREPVLRGCPHPGLKHHPAVLARTFGFVQREVGIAEKLTDPRRVGGIAATPSIPDGFRTDDEHSRDCRATRVCVPSALDPRLVEL